MWLSVNKDEFAAAKVECFHIGKNATPVLVIDTTESEAHYWFELSPRAQSNWLVRGIDEPFTEMSAAVPKNYQDYLYEVILSPLRHYFFNSEPECSVPLWESSRYSYLSSSQASGADYTNTTANPLQKIVGMLGSASQNREVSVVHHLCEDRAGGTAFYRHRRSGLEQQYNAGASAVRWLDEPYAGFELTHYCEAKPGRIMIFPSASLHAVCLPSANPSFERFNAGQLSIVTQLTWPQLVE